MSQLKFFIGCLVVIATFAAAIAGEPNSIGKSVPAKADPISQLFEAQKNSEEQLKKLSSENQKAISDQIAEIKTLKEQLQFLNKRLDDQNERFSDIGISNNLVGLLIGILGILITAVVIIVTFRSEREAKITAQEVLKQWIEEKAEKELEESLNETISCIKRDAEHHIDSVKKIPFA